MFYIMLSIPICGEQTSNELQPLNSTHHWSRLRPWGHPNSSPGVPGGHHTLTCLGIWSLKGCHTSACSGIHQSRDPRRLTRLNLPRDPIFGRSTCLNLPRDLISKRLPCLSLPGDLHPDLGTPGSQVTTVLGRMSLHHDIYSHPRWAN